ncbi:ribonuclease R [Marinobacteraceae bacterium S3BR75-40.1]
MAKRKVRKDPHADREAQNYDKPIYSREYILDYLKQHGAPVTHEALCELLGLKNPDDIEALRRRLIAMCRDGQLICNRRGGYLPVSEVDLIRGRVQGHRDGFGFVIPDEGGSDLFLSARQMRQVFHGDRVLAREDSVDSRGRREGVIVEVIDRASTQMVGRLFRDGGVSMVIPENPRINQEVLVAEDDCGGAGHGQYVTVELLRQPSLRTKATGKVVEVLGDHMAPGMEIDVAIRAHDIPHFWPPAVEEQAKAIPEEVKESDKKGRVDLRDLPLVTIDGEDARDFDDAVYCERRRWGGFRLIVAIADVAHYVRPETPLDVEGLNRGNSVYFPDHVVPMLPEKLSNGLCSLNPKVDRLCMVADMRLSSKGELKSYRFYEGVMYSKARLTYTKVGHMLQAPDSEVGAGLREEYRDVLPNVDALYDLYKVLRKAREARGAIDFETTETKVVFSPDRKIEEIVPVERNDAHKLIEECMLCANVATARFLKKHKLPTLYRVHDGPAEDKLENLRLFLGELGLQLPGSEEPEPKDFQRLLEQAKGRPDFHIIQTVMLRTLTQAVYSPKQKGHFGLGFASYAHFTSPIRRYPDLIVHRGIKSVIHSKRRDKSVEAAPNPDPQLAKYPYSYERMEQLGEHCSMTERRADEATRDVMSWLKCEYLQQHVGEEFDGVISAVTAFGCFVELQGVYTEGLVHVSALHGDFYHFDPVKHRLVGERTGLVFRLGDEMRVQVARVDLEDRKIDLELVGDPQRPWKGDARRAPAGKGRGRKKPADKQGGAAKKTGGKKSSSRKPAAKKGAAKTSGGQTAKRRSR